MYLIRNFCHVPGIEMGAHGFSIELLPQFRECVAESGLTQESVDTLIHRRYDDWMDAAGFRKYDGIGIRVKWGKWGPEHITVPGNACGLDVNNRRTGGYCAGSALLEPHNVDSIGQKYLLMIVFTELASDVVLFARSNKRKQRLGEEQ